ncbi:MAG: flavin oxidoreductase/NADH oxidase [Clostridia bacterium]
MISDPIKLYGTEFKNRVVFQAMEGCDGTTEGGISDLTRRRYHRFATSGTGVIWFEATAATPEGRANPRQLHLTENNKHEFKQLLEEVRAIAMEKFGYAPKIVMQMTHSGRWSKPKGTPEPIVAYRNEHWEIGKEDQPYTVVTDEYCDYVIEKFGQSAKLASEVGFDGIDIKCCHGYLFDEFLSAFNREGRYGGSFENRTRLYFGCIDAVKANKAENVFITTRLNACDCFPYPYGYGVDANNEIDLTECKKIIEIITAKGMEMVDISIGNPYLIPHFNRPALKAPEKGDVGMDRFHKITSELQATFPETAIVMSGLTFPGKDAIEYAEKMLQEGVSSLVGFGRMTFAYPTFYADYLKDGIIDAKKVCIKCSKCTELMRAGSVTGCPIRDQEVYMPLYNKYVLKKG